MARLCAAGAAAIATADREIATRSGTHESSNPDDGSAGAGAGVEYDGRGIRARATVLRGLINADIGPTLREPLYLRVLADGRARASIAAASSSAQAQAPKFTGRGNQRSVRSSRLPATSSALHSRNEAQIARSLESLAARSPATVGAPSPAALRALSIVDACVRPVSSSHAGIAAALAAALPRAARTNHSAVAECLAALLARPRPRGSWLLSPANPDGDLDPDLDGGSATQQQQQQQQRQQVHRRDVDASSRFLRDVTRYLRAADPELLHTITSELGPAPHSIGTLLSSEVEALLVGWVPLTTVLFVWDQWLFVGDHAFAACVAACLVALRAPFIAAATSLAMTNGVGAGLTSVANPAGAIADALAVHGARLTVNAVREQLSVILHAEIGSHAIDTARTLQYSAWVDPAGGPPLERPPPPPFVAARLAEISDTALGWRHRATEAALRAVDLERRVIWNPEPAALMNLREREAVRDQGALAKEVVTLARSRVGTLFRWVYCWVRYLSAVRRRARDRLLGRPWPETAVRDPRVLRAIEGAVERGVVAQRGPQGFGLDEKLWDASRNWAARYEQRRARWEEAALAPIPDAFDEARSANLARYGEIEPVQGPRAATLAPSPYVRGFPGVGVRILNQGSGPEQLARQRAKEEEWQREQEMYQRERHAAEMGSGPAGMEGVGIGGDGGPGAFVQRERNAVTFGDLPTYASDRAPLGAERHDAAVTQDDPRGAPVSPERDAAAVPRRVTTMDPFMRVAAVNEAPASSHPSDSLESGTLGLSGMFANNPDLAASMSSGTLRVRVEDVVMDLNMPTIDAQVDGVVDVANAVIAMPTNIEVMHKAGLHSGRGNAGPTPRRLAALRSNIAREIAAVYTGITDDRRQPRLVLRFANPNVGPGMLDKVELSMRTVSIEGSREEMLSRAEVEVERALQRSNLEDAVRGKRFNKVAKELVAFSLKNRSR